MKKLAVLLFFLSFPSYASTTVGYFSQYPDPIEPQYYGAVGDNVTDDHLAVQSALAAALAQNRPMHLRGWYNMGSTPLVVDGSSVYTVGFNVYGDGPQLSGLNFCSVTSSPAFLLEVASQSFMVNPQLQNFGINYCHSGIALQLGKEDFSDAIVGLRMEGVQVGNTNQSSGCVAIEVNFVLGPGKIDATGNCGGQGYGTALLIHRLEFMPTYGSYGNASKAVYITGTTPANNGTFGNTFTDLDLEAATSDIVVDQTTASANTFQNGQFGWDTTSGHAISTTAGSTFFINPNFYVSTNTIGSSTGLYIQGPGTNMPAGYPNYPTGSGSVTSAGMTGDGTIFNSTVTGSPITTTGTFAPSLHTQTANTILAGATSGAAAIPSFRSLVGADLPSPFTSGSISGNTSTFATTTGALTSGHCAKFDASGNIVDSGAACGGGGGSGAWVELQNATASSSSSITFSSITSGYNQYVITYTNCVPATNGANLLVQIGTSSPITANYTWNSSYAFGSAGNGGPDSSSGDSGFDVTVASGVSNTANIGASGHIWLTGLTIASAHTMAMWDTHFYSGSNDYHVNGSGRQTGTAGAFTSVTVKETTGNISACALSLYGVTN